MDFKTDFKKIERYSKKYSTFLPIYEKYFSQIKKPITLVEVGIFQGGSLEFWSKVLPKQSKIIGIEFNEHAANIKIPGVEIVIGDQSSEIFWNDFYIKYGPIDVLIDDGGHTNKQQIITSLYAIENLNSDGLLIIEDTHFSYMNEVGNPSKYSFINWAFHCANSMNLRFENRKDSTFFSKANCIVKKVYSITFFESLVVFQIKNCELPYVIEGGVPLNYKIEQFRDLNKFILLRKIGKLIRNNNVGFANINLYKNASMILRVVTYKFENFKLKKYFFD